MIKYIFHDIFSVVSALFNIYAYYSYKLNLNHDNEITLLLNILYSTYMIETIKYKIIMMHLLEHPI